MSRRARAASRKLIGQTGKTRAPRQQSVRPARFLFRTRKAQRTAQLDLVQVHFLRTVRRSGQGYSHDEHLRMRRPPARRIDDSASYSLKPDGTQGQMICVARFNDSTVQRFRKIKPLENLDSKSRMSGQNVWPLVCTSAKWTQAHATAAKSKS